MTGFGGSRAGGGDLDVAVEARSVNHRYCDVHVHLPSELQGLAKRIESTIKQGARRGRIDVSVTVSRAANAISAPRVDLARARGLKRVFDALGKEFGYSEPLSLQAIAAAPGVIRIEAEPVDPEAAWEVIAPAVDRALDDLFEMRSREGAVLAQVLAEHLGAVRDLTQRVRDEMPRAISERGARLALRVSELLDGRALEPERLAQEVALLADRSDVTEEVERLTSHCAQAAAILASEDAVGRKMDFLIQEMNREANTIGSKCGDAAVAHVVVDLKVEIERMREQIQNLE